MIKYLNFKDLEEEMAARKNVPHKAVFLTIQKLKETRNAKNC